jgi:hypothetical protein
MTSNSAINFPIVSTLVISVVLSRLVNLISRFF